MLRQLPARSVASLLCACAAIWTINSCGLQEEPEQQELPPPAESNSVSQERLPAAPKDSSPSQGDSSVPWFAIGEEPEAVPLGEASLPLEVNLITDFGYDDPDGIRFLDVLEGGHLYFTVEVTDQEGRGVTGARPKVTPSRDSEVAPVSGESMPGQAEWAHSYIVRAGTMGEESLTIDVEGRLKSLILNIMSPMGSDFAELPDVEGGLEWELLFQAKISWGDQVTAEFPKEIKALSGATVKLAGFMLPLDMTEKQKHFVLASNPPSCFFHVPGGAAGAVEVFAKRPIPSAWDPIVVEGRFEPVERSEDGVVYRLHDARLVK